MRLIARLLVPALLSPVPAPAQEPLAPVQWECWNAPQLDSSVACLEVTAVEEQLMLIPLYGPLVDVSFAQRMVQAVLCGTRTDCRAVLR